MASYKVFQVDAFTKTKFEGNPAGVVLDADGLSERQMQAIARELNNSETAFILSPDAEDHDLHIRYFTPTVEIPVCGHATIASYYARALELGLTNTRVKQKCGAGILDIDVVDSKVFMSQNKPVYGDTDTSAVINALKITEGDLAGEVEVISTGNPKIMVPVKSKELLDNLKPDMLALAALSEPGICVFTTDKSTPGIKAYSRVFAPALGINEDPVTGIACGPLGVYLAKHKLMSPDEEGWISLRARQGEAMGRPGEVDIFINLEAGKVKIAGDAVLCFKTEIEV